MLKKPLYTLEKGNLLVYGNNHDVEIIYSYELTEKELKQFDYGNPDEMSFFRYKGNIYELGEFMRCDNYSPFAQDGVKFDGYSNDTYFSGILIKIGNSGESVKVYTYFSK